MTSWNGLNFADLMWKTKKTDLVYLDFISKPKIPWDYLDCTDKILYSEFRFKRTGEN